MFSITSDLDALTIRRFYERCELLRILANRLPFGRLRHGDPDAIHKCNRLRESFRAGHIKS